ncbi:MAG: PilZ domain-containing protein [Terriglobales bacterium]
MSKNAADTEVYARVRRFPRYRYDARIQLSVFRDGVTVPLWGRTSEFGGDGLGATLTGELHVGEVVSMEFSIPFSPMAIKARAIVRYSSGMRCGFQFLVLTSEQRETIQRLCDLLAATPETASRFV